MSRTELVAKFIIYKYKFKSIIYNYTPNTTFEKGRVEWSAATIRRHVKQFMDLGWCRMQGKHLVFLSKKELHRTVSKKRPIYHKFQCELKLKEVRTRLYYVVAERKLKQCKYMAIKKESLEYRHKIMKNPWLYSEGIKIGLRKLATLFSYRSISSSKKRMREIVDRGLLGNKRFRPQIIFCPKLQDIRYHNPCTLYYHIRQTR